MFEGNSPARTGGISVTGSVHSKLALLVRGLALPNADCQGIAVTSSAYSKLTLLVRGLALRFADCQGIYDALARVAPSNKKKAAHVLIQVWYMHGSLLFSVR